MTTKPELEKLELLQEFYETHVWTKHKYIFIVGKCGNEDCKFGCAPLRMPRVLFNSLRRRQQLVPFPTHTATSGTDHFASYDELVGTETSDRHMPSYRCDTTALKCDCSEYDTLGTHMNKSSLESRDSRLSNGILLTFRV